MFIKKYINVLKTPLLLSLAMFVICGLMYPLVMTGVSRLAFPYQSGGSIIEADGKNIGSEIIGQNFTGAHFMKSRPSAVNYNTYSEKDKLDGSYGGVATGSQNLAPSNPKLAARVNDGINQFLAANPSVKVGDIPTDLLSASGSGLDPHISIPSALIQIPALSSATGLSEEVLKGLVRENTKGKLFGIFGENHVNVLGVNIGIAKSLKMISE